MQTIAAFYRLNEREDIYLIRVKYQDGKVASNGDLVLHLDEGWSKDAVEDMILRNVSGYDIDVQESGEKQAEQHYTDWLDSGDVPHIVWDDQPAEDKFFAELEALLERYSQIPPGILAHHLQTLAQLLHYEHHNTPKQEVR